MRTEDWTEGQKLYSGKYTILKKIGEGGFGLTYMANDCSLNRQVVIKRPNRDFATNHAYDVYIRRFQREGEVLTRIQHPNIVRVIDSSKEVGVPYLVMPYIEGVTLYELLQNVDYLTEGKALDIFRKLADGLCHTHQKGIFHCDIHPKNIILQPNGEPVLIDFGSAKLLQPTTSTITTTYTEFFSPYEQQVREAPTGEDTYRNKVRNKTPVDVYGLAATFFFTVTGTNPPTSLGRKLYGVRLDFPESSKELLSRWLRDAILKGMALEATNRPSSMQLFMSSLYKPKPIQPVIIPPNEANTQYLSSLPLRKQTENAPRFRLRERTKSIKPVVIPPGAYESGNSHQSYNRYIEKFRYISREISWVPLILFSLSSFPTGALIWLLGNTSNGYRWFLVSTEILFTILAGALAESIAKSETAATESIATFLLFIVILLMGGGGAVLGLVLGFGIGFGGILAQTGVLAELVGFGTVVLTGSVVWVLAFESSDRGAIVISALISSLAGIFAGVGTGVGTFLGLLGACAAGRYAGSLDAKWAGVSGISIALTGIATGVLTRVIDSSEWRSVFVFISFLQIVLMVTFLKPTVKSLSTLHSSETRFSFILNATCIVSLLCGAYVALRLSTTLNTAA